MYWQIATFLHDKDKKAWRRVEGRWHIFFTVLKLGRRVPSVVLITLFIGFPPHHHRELALGRISKHVNKPTSHLSTITNTLTHTSIWSNPPNRIVGEIEVAPKHYRKCIVETQQSWKKGEEPIGGILRESSWAGCIPILLKDKVHP